MPVIKQLEDPISSGRVDPDHINIRVEHHTEFVTVTRVTMLDEEAEQWPEATLLLSDVLEMLGLTGGNVICQVSVLVMGPAPEELGALLSKFTRAVWLLG